MSVTKDGDEIPSAPKAKDLAPKVRALVDQREALLENLQNLAQDLLKNAAQIQRASQPANKLELLVSESWIPDALEEEIESIRKWEKDLEALEKQVAHTNQLIGHESWQFIPGKSKGSGGYQTKAFSTNLIKKIIDQTGARFQDTVIAGNEKYYSILHSMEMIDWKQKYNIRLDRSEEDQLKRRAKKKQ